MPKSNFYKIVDHFIGNNMLGDYYPEKFSITLYDIPNKEDIEAIKRGEPVFIQIFADGLPPISVFTLNPNGEVNAL